jgi:hypothetical protein
MATKKIRFTPASPSLATPEFVQAMRDASKAGALVGVHMRRIAESMQASLVAHAPILRAHLLKFGEVNEDGSVFLPGSIALPSH